MGFGCNRKRLDDLGRMVETGLSHTRSGPNRSDTVVLIILLTHISSLLGPKGGSEASEILTTFTVVVIELLRETA